MCAFPPNFVKITGVVIAQSLTEVIISALIYNAEYRYVSDYVCLSHGELGSAPLQSVSTYDTYYESA